MLKSVLPKYSSANHLNHFFLHNNHKLARWLRSRPTFGTRAQEALEYGSGSRSRSSLNNCIGYYCIIKGLDLDLDFSRNMSSKSRSTSNFQHTDSNFSDSDTDSCLDVRMERFLIVGLGNYIYPGTRHSVGMMAVDNLMSQVGGRWEKSRVCGGFLGKSLLTKEDEMVAAELFLFKPQILMNINGRSVLKAAKHLDITADRIYLIHDELDKAVGKCGIKDGGSAKGHKGVLSCYDSLRTSTLWPQSNNGEFKGMTRLQIGIGRPTSQSQIVSYVLSRFHEAELEKINMSINTGLDLLLNHITSRMAT